MSMGGSVMPFCAGGRAIRRRFNRGPIIKTTDELPTTDQETQEMMRPVENKPIMDSVVQKLGKIELKPKRKTKKNISFKP